VQNLEVELNMWRHMLSIFLPTI